MAKPYVTPGRPIFDLGKEAGTKPNSSLNGTDPNQPGILDKLGRGMSDFAVGAFRNDNDAQDKLEQAGVDQARSKRATHVPSKAFGNSDSQYLERN